MSDRMTTRRRRPCRDCSDAIRSYLILWAAQLGAAALFTPVTTRLLGPYRFGLVASSIAVMQVLVALAGFGLQSAVQRRYARSGE